VQQATPAAAPPEQKPAPVIPQEQLAVKPQEKQQPVKVGEKNKQVMVAKNNSKGSRNMVASNKQKRQPAVPPDAVNDESLQLREIVMARDESDDNVPRLYDLISDSN
jgi:hypothetical protein